MDPKLNSLVLWLFFVFIGIAILIVFFWIWKTEKRLKKFFAGKKARDLEASMVNLDKNLSELLDSQAKTTREIHELKTKLKKSVRNVQTLRFNPFPDHGGNQSFAIGFVDEEGDGVVLSSLYSRERMSVFAKPVKKGASEYELTAEEKKVLEQINEKNK